MSIQEKLIARRGRKKTRRISKIKSFLGEIQANTVASLILAMASQLCPNIVPLYSERQSFRITGESSCDNSLTHLFSQLDADERAEVLTQISEARSFYAARAAIQRDVSINNRGAVFSLFERDGTLWGSSSSIDELPDKGVEFEACLPFLLSSQADRSLYVSHAIRCFDPEVFWQSLIDVCGSKGMATSTETTDETFGIFRLQYEYANSLQPFLTEAILNALELRIGISPLSK